MCRSAVPLMSGTDPKYLLVRLAEIGAELEDGAEVLEVAGPGAGGADVHHVPLAAGAKAVVLQLKSRNTAVGGRETDHDHGAGQRVALHAPAEARLQGRLALHEL